MKKLWNFLSVVLVATSALATVSCADDDGPTPLATLAEKYAGKYQGTITLNVAGQYSYNADVTCIITAGDNETITVSLSEYSLSETMMGDITLGAVDISNVSYDETKGGFYRDFGGEGVTQTMNGTSYPLNDPTSILVTKNSDGKITVDYPFTLGKMPLPLTATFVSK